MLRLGTQIESFLKINFASAYWKDKKGTYLEVNDIFIAVSNSQSPNEVLGKNDKELIWREEASFMMQNDQEVIYTGCSKMVLEKAKACNGSIVHYLSYKVPTYTRSNQISGVFGLSFLVDPENPLFNVLAVIDSSNLFYAKQDKEITSNEPKLSKRQIECLYYLVRGMTIKQIATTLELSPKTVEHYLEMVKNKLNCHSRYELISRALSIKTIKDRL